MRKIGFGFLLLFFPMFASLLFSRGTERSAIDGARLNAVEEAALDPSRLLYEDMKLEGVVNPEAFKEAIAGFYKINNRKKEVLTLIDFSLPSTEKRMFIFDLEKKQLLFRSLVSHGRNSGQNYATSFSNRSGSYMSSLGFYLTDHTYSGKNGYSLLLNGLEKGINNMARARAIVVHGASYANPEVIKSGGRLGRSLGCPAIPQKLTRPIIDTIKDGSVMFIYAKDKNYHSKSDFV